MKKNQEIAVVDEKLLAQLKADFPVDLGFKRVLLPRLSIASQDVTDGKGKSMKVVTEAGTFFTEVQIEETDEQGKKLWEKNEIGTSFNGVILYQRKQLRFYDSATKTYTSSPIFDDESEIVPLFCNKAEIDRGTPAELKARKEYQGVSAKGKPISKLEENRILYVLYDGKVHQMTLRGTSMYAWLTYARTVLAPAVMTTFSSESKENGSIAWNQMTFEMVRPLAQGELEEVMEHVAEIKQGIMEEKNWVAASPQAEKF